MGTPRLRTDSQRGLRAVVILSDILVESVWNEILVDRGQFHENTSVRCDLGFPSFLIAAGIDILLPPEVSDNQRAQRVKR